MSTLKKGFEKMNKGKHRRNLSAKSSFQVAIQWVNLLCFYIIKTTFCTFLCIVLFFFVN